MADIQAKFKKNYFCDMYEDDIVNSLVKAMEMTSEMEAGKEQSESIALIKQHNVTKQYMNENFAIRLGLFNLESSNYATSTKNLAVAKKALSNSTFWGVGKGIFGSTDYFSFKNDFVNYHFKEDPEATKWSVKQLKYRIEKSDDGELIILIDAKRYKISYDFDNKEFVLKSLEEGSEETYFQFQDECSA